MAARAASLAAKPTQKRKPLASETALQRRINELERDAAMAWDSAMEQRRRADIAEAKLKTTGALLRSVTKLIEASAAAIPSDDDIPF